MNCQTKRLFISNLPDNVSQSDIETKFAQFGTVSSVDVKQRKNVVGNQSAQFAYINLEIDEQNVQPCLRDFMNNKWHGHYVDVQLARESFIERLKREREEVKVNGTGSESTFNNSKNDTNTEVVDFEDSPPRKKRLKETYQDFSEPKFKGEDEYYTPRQNRFSNNQEDYNYNYNDKAVEHYTYPSIKKTALKIESVGNKPIFNSEKLKKTKILDSKQKEADDKRLQSVTQMKKGYQQQKSLIQAALSNIDSSKSNKIIFDENVKKHADVSHNDNNYEVVNKMDAKRSKLALFEDEDDYGEQNDDVNFELKQHFEGKKGQKLLELQSRFKNDKRFTVDERFLEEESEGESNEKRYGLEPIQDDEKEKQLAILEEVIGKKIVVRSSKNQESESKKPKGMLRFDPTQPQHSQFEIKEAQTSKKKKKLRKEENNTKKVEDVEKPEVSKEQYFKVTDTLKESLQGKQEFSLLSLFGKTPEKDKANENEEYSTKELKKKTNHFDTEANPFRYDSSDDEVEEDNQTIKEPVEAVQKPQPMKLWTESFFFKEDDYRLQEGIDFIRRLEGNKEGDFSVIRRNLKEIVRSKVKNNLKKNGPFKRKLGGKKRIKVKRAMKR